MWRKRLRQLLVEFGLKALQSDPSVYCMWDGSNRLVLVLSTHVDDLKGGGEEDLVSKLWKHLEAAVGEGKLQYGTFEHCGVRHIQSGDRLRITTCMDHYVKQLKPIVSLELKVKADEEQDASEALTALYASFFIGRCRLVVAIESRRCRLRCRFTTSYASSSY